jgi:hypothetical protein
MMNCVLQVLQTSVVPLSSVSGGRLDQKAIVSRVSGLQLDLVWYASSYHVNFSCIRRGYAGGRPVPGRTGRGRLPGLRRTEWSMNCRVIVSVRAGSSTAGVFSSRDYARRKLYSTHPWLPTPGVRFSWSSSSRFLDAPQRTVSQNRVASCRRVEWAGVPARVKSLGVRESDAYSDRSWPFPGLALRPRVRAR